MGFNDINHLKKDACLINDTEMCEGFIVITSTYTSKPHHIRIDSLSSMSEHMQPQHLAGR